MLMLIQKLVKEEIQENVDINDWREVRKAYYLYTFISFLLVAERALNECFGNNKNVLGRNLVSNTMYERITNCQCYNRFVYEINRKYNQEDLGILYQKYISCDFFINDNGRFEFRQGKYGRDVIGAYYTNETFAYEIVKKTIEFYLFNREMSDARELLHLKYVDSACGAGDFLLAIVDVLKKEYGFCMQEISEVVANIWGIDVDPIAVLITKTRLMLKVGCEKCNSHIMVGNPLIQVKKSISDEEKLELAMEGRFYNERMGIIDMEEKFDVIVGNPPWEKVRFEEKKFLSHFSVEAAGYNKMNRRKYIEAESLKNRSYFEDIYMDYELFKKTIKKQKAYKLSAVGELNTYALFTEWSIRNVNTVSAVGLIVKSSLVQASIYTNMFEYLVRNKMLYRVYMYTNKQRIFQIDSREEFSVVLLSAKCKGNLKIAVGLQKETELCEPLEIDITYDDIALINPDTKMLPSVNAKEQMDFLLHLSREHQMFGKIYSNCRFGRLVHLTNHSDNIVKRNIEGYVPIYEGKFIEQYNGCYATFANMEDNTKYCNKASARLIENLYERPESRYFIEETKWNELSKKFTGEWFLVWRSLTSSTNRRTMIATILPKTPTCQSLQLLQMDNVQDMLIVLGLFNSIVFDYLVRLKMVGLDLTQTILQQIPVPSKCVYNEMINFMGVEDLLSNHIIVRIKALYAKDDRLNGLFEQYKSILTKKEKNVLMAELDKLYAIAYGISNRDLKQIAQSFDKYYQEGEIDKIFAKGE